MTRPCSRWGWIAVVLAGCTASTKSSSSSSDRSRGHSPPEAILWIAGLKGPARALWLRETSAGVEILGKREGVVIAAGAGLWTIQRRPIRVTGADLDCALGLRKPGDQAPPFPLPAACEKTLTLQETCLHELVHGQRRCLPFPRPGQPAVEWIHEVRPEASVGPYLFVVEQHRGTAYLSAHGSTDRRLRVIDLSRGGQDLNDGSSYCEGVSFLRAAVQRNIVKEHLRAMESALCSWQRRESPGQGDSTACASLAPGEVEVTGVFPSLSAEGVLSAQVQLTTKACWNGRGDQRWCDYTCSFRAPLRGLPTFLQRLGRAPALVRRALRLIPLETAAGWSMVEGDPARRDQVRAAFFRPVPR